MRAWQIAVVCAGVKSLGSQAARSTAHVHKIASDTFRMSIILSVPFVGAVLGFLGLRLGDNPINVLDYHLLLRRFALVLVGDADAVGY